MNRRTPLAYGGLAAVAGLSGCPGFAPRGAGREGVVLTHVELGNGTDEPRAFDVLVRHDGDVVHWATHEVGVGIGGEMGGRVVDPDGPDEPGRVVVRVRVGGTWRSLDFRDHERYDGERVVAVVTYGMVEDELRVRPHASDRTTAGSA